MSDTAKHKGNAKPAEVVDLERRKLLARHCAGDANAFPELVKLFGDPIYSYVIRSGVEAGARDDVVQEIFIKIHSQAHLYQAERPLEPWLFTIVANTVRSHYRKVRVREILGELPSEEARSVDQNAEERTQSKQTVEWLSGAIGRLPLQQQEVLNLCCVTGMEQKEVARILNMPVNTVKTHLSRARIALAKALSRRKAELRREASS